MQQGYTINEVGFVCIDLITLVNKSYIDTKINRSLKNYQANAKQLKCL